MGRGGEGTFIMAVLTVVILLTRLLTRAVLGAGDEEGFAMSPGIGHPAGGQEGAQQQRDKREMDGGAAEPLHGRTLGRHAYRVKEKGCRMGLR